MADTLSTARDPLRQMRRWSVSVGALCLLGCAALDVAATTPLSLGRYSEIDIKAAFLYQFCNYVQWPSAAGQAAALTPLTIGVVGADDVVEELKRILPGRKVSGRELQVLRIESLAQAGATQLLFVGKRTHLPLARFIETLRGQPILIVTEQPRGLEQGAMINFVPAQGRLRFELAPVSAEKRGLKLSSRLMPIALRVREEE